MPGTKRKTKKTKTKRIKWKAAAIELGKCAIFALKFASFGRGGSGGSVVTIDKKTGGPKTMGPWEDMFFDALELIGTKYDRKKYYSRPKGRK